MRLQVSCLSLFKVNKQTTTKTQLHSHRKRKDCFALVAAEFPNATVYTAQSHYQHQSAVMKRIAHKSIKEWRERQCKAGARAEQNATLCQPARLFRRRRFCSSLLSERRKRQKRYLDWHFRKEGISFLGSFKLINKIGWHSGWFLTCPALYFASQESFF